MKSFLSKKSILRTMAVAAVCMLGATSVKAQEFTIQGDYVSSYVWRGIYQGGAAAFQPTLGFSAGNFSLTAWGSTSLSESNKEIDLTAAYKFGETGPVLSVATLWWDGQGAGNYFHFKSGDTGHHLHFHLVPKYTDEYEWGGTFEMNPGKKFLSDEEYAQMIEKIKAELV